MILANERIRIKPSSIHGFGGFALTDIVAGTNIIEYLGEKIDKNESFVRCQQHNECIFYLDEQWNLDGNVDWNPARFLNHSCEPNCEAKLIADRIWIVARRDIQAGEEITFNYGYDFQDYEEHVCHCGSARCVGFIVAEEFFGHVRAKRQRLSEVYRGSQM